jgi:hypothetical protein
MNRRQFLQTLLAGGVAVGMSETLCACQTAAVSGVFGATRTGPD